MFDYKEIFDKLSEQYDSNESFKPVDYEEHLKALSDIAETLKKDYELALANAEAAKKQSVAAFVIAVLGAITGLVGAATGVVSLIFQFCL